MKKILVPIDGSDESKRSATKAVEIAKLYGAELTFLIVVEADLDIMFTDSAIMPTSEYTGIRDTMLKIKTEASGKMLDALIDSLDTANLKVSKRVIVGNAHPQIIEVAKKGGYDLIVIGHRGLNPVHRFFLGSVAKRVIEDSPCPVLVEK